MPPPSAEPLPSFGPSALAVEAAQTIAAVASKLVIHAGRTIGVQLNTRSTVEQAHAAFALRAAIP
jgi:hypothetical protein